MFMGRVFKGLGIICMYVYRLCDSTSRSSLLTAPDLRNAYLSGYILQSSSRVYDVFEDCSWIRSVPLCRMILQWFCLYYVHVVKETEADAG